MMSLIGWAACSPQARAVVRLAYSARVTACPVARARGSPGVVSSWCMSGPKLGVELVVGPGGGLAQAGAVAQAGAQEVGEDRLDLHLAVQLGVRGGQADPDRLGDRAAQVRLAADPGAAVFQQDAAVVLQMRPGGMTAVKGASSSRESCRAGSSLPWLYSIARMIFSAGSAAGISGLQLGQHLGRRGGGEDGQHDGHRQRVPAEQAGQVLQGLPFGVVVQPASGVVAAQDAVGQGGGGLRVQARQRVDVVRRRCPAPARPRPPGSRSAPGSCPPRSRDSRVAELGLLGGVQGVRDRRRGRGDRLGVIQDQQVPGRAQQPGGLLQLRRRRA